MPKELPILKLADATAWKTWLAHEGSTSTGVMLATVKKGAVAADTTLRYDQALDEALCVGWIDSGGRKVDNSIYLYRFCPRKADSLWSQRNVGYVERLEKEQRIQPAGRAAIELAKANGRWASAYSGSGATEMPADFLAALQEVPAAQATWNELTKGNRWIIYFRLNNLKTTAGRKKRIKAFVDMLARGETPNPQKRNQKQGKNDRAASLSSKSTDAPIADLRETKSSQTRTTRSGRSIPSYVE